MPLLVVALTPFGFAYGGSILPELLQQARAAAGWLMTRLLPSPGAPTPPAVPPPVPTNATRVRRWGDGLAAPAAGARHFWPQGHTFTRDVPASIAVFGHSPSHIRDIMNAGEVKAHTSPAALAAKHAAALYAYTEESPLYGVVNHTMRTPHTADDPTDTQLRSYADYINHTMTALGSLPAHVSERHGPVYRGIRVLLDPALYATGRDITWQVRAPRNAPPPPSRDLFQRFPLSCPLPRSKDFTLLLDGRTCDYRVTIVQPSCNLRATIVQPSLACMPSCTPLVPLRLLAGPSTRYHLLAHTVILELDQETALHDRVRQRPARETSSGLVVHHSEHLCEEHSSLLAVPRRGGGALPAQFAIQGARQGD